MRVRDLAAGTLTLTVACLWGPALAQDASAPNPHSFYRLGPDSLEQDGVPKGEINYAWGMNRHGQAMGGAILPEMMRWLWRDHPVSTDPRDTTERSMRSPAARK